jgi:endonuclease/exonuclease/phosphatase family metal-dependent hydrolase
VISLRLGRQGRIWTGVLLLAAAGSPGFAQQEAVPPPAFELPAAIEVPLAWRLDYDLCEPETAVRDAQASAIYVSNVCGFSKDGHGFLTKVSDSGEILERFWADGLDAPAGLAIEGRTLWAVDIDVVRGFDLDTAKPTTTLTFPAEFAVRALNDLAIAPDGTIYVSDSGQRAIYRLRNGKPERFVQDDRLEFANGLLLERGLLWAGSGSGLYTVNLGTGAIGGPVGPPLLTDIDGIESDGSRGLLVSIVGGDVWHLPENGPLEIFTTPGLASSNLGCFPEIGLIVVPTGTDGTLLAFRFPPPPPAPASGTALTPHPVRSAVPTTVRIATFNVRELSTAKLEAVDAAGFGTDPQLRAAAEIVRRVRPDILVLQEIDHDVRQPDDLTLNGRRFVERYLAAETASEGSAGSAPLDYPYLYAAPSNTGIPSGQDLNNDGQVAGPDQVGDRTYGEDSFGFGLYPGQFATILLSRYPIRGDEARTFQLFRWSALPGNHIPSDFYSPEEVEILRLSSKSHWDVPVEIGPTTLHLWISHPTPPVYDGPEDRNGRRNYDEVAFWLAYLDGEPALVDDAGLTGGWTGGSGGDDPFLIVGDLNADTEKGDAFEVDGKRAIERLLDDPRLEDTAPFLHSTGALVERAREATEPEHAGAPDFPERATAVFLGGMRIDYLLPSRDLGVEAGGVFWPSPDEDPEGARLAEAASDHRLVWLDLRVPRR